MIIVSILLQKHDVGIAPYQSDHKTSTAGKSPGTKRVLPLGTSLRPLDHKKMASFLAQSAEEMYVEFTERMRELETLSLLKSNPMSPQDLKNFALAITKAEALMDELTRLTDRDRAAIPKAKRVIKRLRDVKSRGAKLERYLFINKTNNLESDHDDDEQTEEIENQHSRLDDDDNTINIISRANQQQLGPTKVATPSLKQFESIPKYMRSLLQYDDFCKICELVNLTAERKRLIMEAPSDRLGPNARASLLLWKSQQTEDLSNLTFITQEDVTAELENERKFKSNDIKAALQCLRNLDFVKVAPFENVDLYVFLK
jgi:Spindle and kinetochore-associated protein 1